MAAAIARRALNVSCVATPSGKRAPAPRVVPRAALSDGSPKLFRETGGADAGAATGAIAPVSTPFDGYSFAPIREATVSVLCPLEGLGWGCFVGLGLMGRPEGDEFPCRALCHTLYIRIVARIALPNAHNLQSRPSTQRVTPTTPTPPTPPPTPPPRSPVP